MYSYNFVYNSVFTNIFSMYANNDCITIINYNNGSDMEYGIVEEWSAMV